LHRSNHTMSFVAVCLAVEEDLANIHNPNSNSNYQCWIFENWM
jgi:hypothetical protein